jgi:hypothetical protein
VFITSFATILIMQEDYINTSHPNFIGGSKAVEQAQQQVRSARMSTTMVKKVYLLLWHDAFVGLAPKPINAVITNQFIPQYVHCCFLFSIFVIVNNCLQMRAHASSLLCFRITMHIDLELHPSCFRVVLDTWTLLFTL